MIQIGNKKYKGNNVSIIGGKVIIDGKEVSSENNDEKNITINLSGNVRKLIVKDANECIINGDIGGNVDANNLKCGNIGGNVDANIINCKEIHGNVDANIVNR